MVYFHSSISFCNSVDRSSTTIMANPVNSNEFCSKSKQNNQVYKNRKTQNHPNCCNIHVCDGSRSVVIDVVILIAVIGACGFLIFPYVKFAAFKLIEFYSAVHYVVKDEVIRNPVIFGSIGVSSFGAALTAWIVISCMMRKCGNPNCKGLRKAAEFDIQLEREECVKNSNGLLVKDGGVKRGVFELPRDHHRELQAELKRIAPPNGRAVLVFRARCGCSVGILEVLGPKKLKKIKK